MNPIWNVLSPYLQLRNIIIICRNPQARCSAGCLQQVRWRGQWASLPGSVLFVFILSRYFYPNIFYASGILEVAGKPGITESTPEINNLKVTPHTFHFSLFWLLKDGHFLRERSSFYHLPPFNIKHLRNSAFSGNLYNLRVWQPELHSALSCGCIKF